MSLLDVLTGEERDGLPEAPPPDGSAAMRAVLTDDRFSDPAWIFERKLDGIRCIAVRDGGEAELYSRNDLSMNARYPEIAAAMTKGRFAIDGEIVAFDGDQTSFTLLTRRAREYVPVFYYVFDVLWAEGRDLRGLPLLERKKVLRAILSDFGEHVVFTEHRDEDGEAFFKQACRSGWEGLIAKRADSTYSSTRSKDWLKFKCAHGQELVIGGFTAPKGTRIELGALLVGFYTGGELQYAGKVGTGFDRETLKELGTKLRALERRTSPFAEAVRERDVTWVTPSLVCEVGFSEWTRDHRLRHPRFLGLRDDKSAEDVVRE
jgi:bifunctional non-homologous end joining protein LigD